MRVLVACEFSGTVAQAFRDRGHDAWSCDLLPSALCLNPQHTIGEGDCCGHLIGDVAPLLQEGAWDLLIAHPPCTYLCNSGVRWLYGGKGTTRDEERWTQMEGAARFVAMLWNAPVARVAIENPIMHGHAQRAIHIASMIGRGPEGPTDVRWAHWREFGSPTQIIQPWQFGHGETKATGLWLRGLPKLQPTRVMEGRRPRVHHESPGPDRWKRRSVTYPGIAEAMADQWGSLP